MARRNSGTAAGYPAAAQAAKPSTSRSAADASGPAAPGSARAAPAISSKTARLADQHGEQRRVERLEQRLAGTAHVRRRERPRRLQQDRCRLARLPEGKADRALQPPGLRAGQRVAELRRRLLRRRAGPDRLTRGQRRLGRLEQPPGALALPRGQLRRAGQERHRRGVPAAVRARPAACSSRAATASSGPRVAIPRCQATRSGRSLPSPAAASA